MNQNLRAAQMNHVDMGKLQVQTTSAVGGIPVKNAKITNILYGRAGKYVRRTAYRR